jgi:mannose-6-phosphate isomerase-like protein (cupin superfamily)
MTFTNQSYQKPKSLYVNKEVAQLDLIVHGQGTLIFDASSKCSLVFSDLSGVNKLKVKFTDTNVLVNLLPSNEPLIDTKNTKGIVQEKGAYYWFSLDSQNQRLYAGIGEARKETLIYQYEFPSNSKTIIKPYLESLSTVYLENLKVGTILRDPITACVPLLVKDREELTMNSVALGKYMPEANLSQVSQKLYNCISGKKFLLNTPDFPEFSMAIDFSIKTPGKWCYECLKQKATEFNKDKPNEKETYLRITLGENNGESPGIPYVMEIWPSGHYSPVHNHGGCSAVIRVLEGSILVNMFPYLGEASVPPFTTVEIKKDDVTWISPTLNQVHQLNNPVINKTTCITIQCYMYENSDTVHYDYFDYLDVNNQTQQFEPNSDMEFIEFKKTIKREWYENKRKTSWLSSYL